MQSRVLSIWYNQKWRLDDPMISLQKCSRMTYRWREWRIWSLVSRSDSIISLKENRDMKTEDSRNLFELTSKRKSILKRRAIWTRSTNSRKTQSLLVKMTLISIHTCMTKRRRRRMWWSSWDRKPLDELISKNRENSRVWRKNDPENSEEVEIDIKVINTIELKS